MHIFIISFKKIPNCERGNILLMALMILLILSILATGIIRVASMEKKVSHYSCQQEQIQQAADAGVEWAIEMIYESYLKDRVFPQGVDPDFPSGSSVILATQSMAGSSEVKWIISNCSLFVDSANNRYLYTFDSTGTYKDTIKKKVRVIVGYIYDSRSGEINIRWVDPDNCSRGIVSYELISGS